MAGLQQDFSEQETKQLIADVANGKGNNFRVRVMRRRPGGGGLDVVALFDEGTAEQIAFAEKWLPDLAGGGNYLVQAFHESEATKQIGSSISLSIDNINPRNVNFNATQSASWAGPRGLSYPNRPSINQNGNGLHVDGGGGAGAEAIGPQKSIGSGSTPLGAPPLAHDPSIVAMERAQRAEQALQEERRRNEIEAIRTANAQSVKALEAQLSNLQAELREERNRAASALEAAKNAAPKESGMEVISKVLAALSPMATAMLQHSNEMKLRMMEMEAKNAQATLESARQQSEQLNKILTTMMDTRGKIDPMMQLMFDQLKDAKTKESPLASMQGALQLITAAKDAGFGGGGEGGMGEVAVEIARAASSAFEAYVVSKSGAPPAGQQQIEIPQQPQAQPRKRVTAMQQLDRMIKAHHNVTETATFFMDAISRDQEVRQRFAGAGQDIEAFFKTYWAAWAMQAIDQHGPYVMALNEAVLKAAGERGLVRRPAVTAQPQAPQPPPQQAPAPVPVPQQPPAPEQPGEPPVDPGEGGEGGPGDEGTSEDEVDNGE